MDLWLDEDEELSPNELENEVFHAMRNTDPIKFHIYDQGASSIFFDGPDFVEGHFIEVQFNGEGRLVSVGLAG